MSAMPSDITIHFDGKLLEQAIADMRTRLEDQLFVGGIDRDWRVSTTTVTVRRPRKRKAPKPPLRGRAIALGGVPA